MSMKITFITGNQHKVKEAKGIFDKLWNRTGTC